METPFELDGDVVEGDAVVAAAGVFLRDAEHAWYVDVPDRWFDTNFLDIEWFEWACDAPISCGPGCGSVRPEYYGTPIEVRVRRTPRGHMQSAPLALVVSEELGRLLESELDGPVFGTCVSVKTGLALSSHRTVYSIASKSALVLGAHGTRYRRCGRCGLVHKGRPSKTSDDQMIDRESIPPRRRVAQVLGHGGLVVTDEFRRLLEGSLETKSLAFEFMRVV